MSAARDEFLAKVKRQVQRAVDAGFRAAKAGKHADDAEVIAICVVALAEEYAAKLAPPPAVGPQMVWLLWQSLPDARGEVLLAVFPDEASAQAVAERWQHPTRVSCATWSGSLPPGIVP